jgi:hypothetical protein
MPGARVHSLSEVIAYNNQHPDRVKYGQNLLQASDATPGRSELFGPQSDPARSSAKGSIDGALAETSSQAIVTPGNANANIGAAAGYPTVIVPLGYTNGGKDPFGIGFLGQAYTEPRLLGYAYAYEQSSHARVPPTDVNPKLQAASCPASAASSKPRSAHRLRVRVRRAAHRRLKVKVTGALGSRVSVVARRGRHVVARRSVRTRHGAARLQLRLRPGVRGRVRVIALDAGPPPRTAKAKIRIH